MAIEGINTGSGYSGYGGGKGIGSLSRESISKTSGNSVSASQGAGGVNGGLGVSSEPMENQVAVSPDGDTVQISKKAVAKYDAASEAKKSEKLDENEQKEALGNVRQNKAELKARAVAKMPARQKKPSLKKGMQPLKNWLKKSRKGKPKSQKTKRMFLLRASQTLILRGFILKARYQRMTMIRR